VQPIRRLRAPGWLAGAVLGLAAVGVVAAPSRATAGPIGIIGGTTTTVDQYPSVVALVINNNLCTGTLIAPTWVLTAAHCVDPAVLNLTAQDQVTAAMRVHFHTIDVVNDAGTVVAARATYKDPLFNKDHLGANDIGLVELDQAVTDVAPMPINLVAAMAPAGIRVTTVGYGSQGSTTDSTVGVELELKSRVTVSCPSLGIGSNTNLLCFSQADHTGTCQGDSGGPSFGVLGGRLVVVGVTSFGDQGCAEFGASTRVDIEQPFLLTYVPELIGCVEDRDCPANRACFAHACIAEPFSPTGLGTLCTTADDCESAECAESSKDGKRCSVTCSVSNAASCPDGFDCLRAGGDVGACWPSDNAGCCSAGGAGGPAAMLLGLGVVVAMRRRRRGG
jgi:hypothetical protein